MTDPIDRQHCFTQLPGLFVSSNIPQSILYPDTQDRHPRADAKANGENRHQTQYEVERTSSCVSPRPTDLLHNSFISTGHPSDCTWERWDGRLMHPPRCQNFDVDTRHPSTSGGEPAYHCPTGKSGEEAVQGTPPWQSAKLETATPPPSSATTTNDGSPRDLTASNGATRLFSIPESAFHCLASFLPRRIFDDESSQAATAGTDTRQLTEIGNDDASVQSPESHPFFAADTSHYLVEPNSDDPAQFFYKATSDGGHAEWQSDKVVLRAVRLASRKPAYIFEASAHDNAPPRNGQAAEVSNFLNERHDLDTPGLQLGTGGALKSALADPGCSMLSAGCSTSHDCSDNIDQSRLHCVMHKVRQHLMERRLSGEHRHLIDQSGRHAQALRGSYLIGEEHLRDVVELTLAAANEVHSVRILAASDAENCHDKSSPLIIPRTAEKQQGILPSSQPSAGPATTINTTEAFIVSRHPAEMQVHTRTTGQDKSKSATIVTRRSVAEIAWAQNNISRLSTQAHEQLGNEMRQISHRSPASGRQSTGPDLASNSRCETKVRLKSFSVHHYTTGDNYADLVATISRAQETSRPQVDDRSAGITSFPPLLSRHCTEDWISPPPDFSDLSRRVSADLYYQGVDAHCGKNSTPPSQISVQPVHSRLYDIPFFGKASPFAEASYNYWARRGTEPSQSPAREKRLGSSIGSASRRRRSSLVQRSKTAGSERKEGVIPELLDKIRRGGHKVFHHNKHHPTTRGRDAHLDSQGQEMHTPQNSVTGNGQSSTKPRSRDSIVRAFSPELPMLDSSGIYEAMTGSRLVVPSRRRDTWSEDNQPHVCQFEMATPLSGGATPD